MAERLEKLHEQHPDMGYRRLTDKIRHDDHVHVNDKRILRICRKKQIRSSLKYRHDGCTRPSKNPDVIAENVLDRDFHAEKLNEKWVTDVTEFKYGTSFDDIHKLYLSTILDLCDLRPVAYVISDHNDNKLVLDTFDAAVAANPDARPIFHRDRGSQYTSKEFHKRLEQAGMIQSMSRVAHCTDNGPMEGFWGILKREMYYTKKFHKKEELVQAIEDYMFLLSCPKSIATNALPPVPIINPKAPSIIGNGMIKFTAANSVFPTKFDTKNPSTTP